MESSNLPQKDPALQTEHQHTHTHHHHTAFAQQGHEEEVVYTNETAFEKGVVSEPTPLDHGEPYDQGDKDTEAGKSQPGARPWYRRITKHSRHIAHAVVWLLFTG